MKKDTDGDELDYRRIEDLDPDNIPSLRWEDLRAMGIPWSRAHIRRLTRKGLFPRPYRWSPRRLLWKPRHIRTHIDDLMPDA